MPTELAEGIWWFDFSGVNAYLVDDGGDLTLIDGGMPWHAKRVVGGLRDLGYDLGDVERVLVTHFDADHVGALGKLDDLRAPIYVGEGDAGLVTHDATPSLSSRKGLMHRITSLFTSRPNATVHPLTDGDTIGSFTVYATPGHTPGHVAYVSESLSLGVLGDLVMENDGELVSSPWIMSADTDQVRRSIREFAERAPAFEVAVMGHGTPFPRGGSEQLQRLAATV